MEKDIIKVLISEEEIQEAVDRLAKKINEDYQDKNIILIGLLKGSVVFMADLMKKIDMKCKIDFIAVSSYENSTKSSGRIKINSDVSQSVEGLDVLIVEDIIDSGNTLDYMLKYFDAKKANSIKICTLLDKPDRREVDIPVDYVGFEIPDEFVIGYGLDYSEYYRNLPYIGVLDEEVYS